jgi:aspartyl-tRNA(Asn)/glutamyl-tRNA(Gln) amidotransferase subunit A
MAHELQATTPGTVAGLAAALAAKQVSSVEVTQHFLDAIARANPDLNAYITVTAEQALAAAAAADARRAAGDAGPLTGVPLAHKDLFCTEGVRTSCGSRMLDSFVSPYDATVVARTRAAGMPMLGKLNMDEFAMGSSNEHSWYGPVRNPWDLARVPGGSSGGSAAAVAAGLTPIATGTDTGGSIRQPASFCGITGLKPTYGRVSRYGMVAFASSFDQAGPMARTAEDCALLLQALAGVDPRDATSMDVAVPDYAGGLGRSLAGLRIGLPKEYLQDLDPALAAALDAVRHEFEALGATFVDCSLPNTALAIPAYYILAPAECSANLSRFDGVRFGHRCEEPKDLFDLYTRSRAEGFGAEVQRRILTGTYVLSIGYHDAYYVQAQRVRRLIRDDFLRAYEQVDLLLTPTAPGTAFRLGELADPLAMYAQDVYTTTANLAGIPAMSFPMGFLPAADGGKALPIGAQLLGPHFGEPTLLAAAHQFQQRTDWHLRLPAGAQGDAQDRGRA